MSALTLIEPASNVDAYRASTDAASLCKEIVVASATNIQGRKYVCVEGWQAIAIAHGCTASARDVERIDGGVRAIGEIRRMSDGRVIATAEGFVGEDEPVWFGGTDGRGKKHPRRLDYAIRAMAQTRSISRASRSAFAHVVVMMNAGLSTTPAEEVPFGGFDDAARPAERQPEQRQAEQRQATPVRITSDERDILMTLLEKSGADVRAFCEHFKVGALPELAASDYRKATDLLEKKLRKQASASTAPVEHRQPAPVGDIIDDDVPY